MDQSSVSMPKPSANSAAEQPKKRHHRLRNFLVTIGVIVIGLAILVSATGVYSVPVISSVFGTNHPKNLGVKTSTEALASMKQKIPMKISGVTVDYAQGSAKAFEGSIPVVTSTNSAEITSWLERFEGADPLFTDTQVKKFEGGLEISTMLQKYVKAPIYVKVMVTNTATNAIALDITKAKLGVFTVPAKYLPQVEEFFTKRINSAMANIPGFRMDTYAIHEDSSSFKGTFPAVAHPSAAGWSGLLSL